MFGMMCNMIIFPENNPATRNSFSCGQSKQACHDIIQIIKYVWIKRQFIKLWTNSIG